MQPIVYEGHPYFSSQYFHQQYLANSQYGGKYKRHHDFLRLLRSIEAYQTYVDHGDIVELSWQQVKSSSKQDLRLALEPVFAARGYQELFLLNATAQLAMAHHLDDELSKQVSVAANTTIARQVEEAVASSGNRLLQIQALMLAEVSEMKAVIVSLQQDVKALQDAQKKLTIAQWVRKNKMQRRIEKDDYAEFSNYMAMCCHANGIAFSEGRGGTWWHNVRNKYTEDAYEKFVWDWLKKRYAQLDTYGVPNDDAWAFRPPVSTEEN